MFVDGVVVVFYEVGCGMDGGMQTVNCECVFLDKGSRCLCASDYSQVCQIGPFVQLIPLCHLDLLFCIWHSVCVADSDSILVVGVYGRNVGRSVGGYGGRSVQYSTMMQVSRHDTRGCWESRFFASNY